MTFTPPPPEMQALRQGKTEQQRNAARALLGLEDSASEAEINDAFRKTVKFTHPDMGGAGFDMAELKWARDLLLSEINQATQKSENETCPMCGGRGSVSLSFGAEPCGSCGGTGKLRS